MRIYLVDRDLPGFTVEAMVALQQAAIEMSRRCLADGKSVRYLRSVFMPSESHCMCLFEAESAKLVQELNEAAEIPFTRIIEALELTGSEESPTT